MNESDRLKSVGLKVTGPRLKILQLLGAAPRQHWRAEDLYQALYEQGEEIGFATVYRVLTQLEKAYLVRRHRFEEEHAVFELADPNHHDHLVCTECGKVEEFVDAIIEARRKLIAERASYVLKSHALNLYGVCASCYAP